MVATDGSGELRKEFSGPGSFTFPVGDNTGGDGAQYTPATLNFTALRQAGYAGMRVVDAVHTDASTAPDFLSRYWTVTAGSLLNGFTAQTTFKYDPSDVNGVESEIMGGKWNGDAFTKLGLVDPATHTFGGAVTSFSDFTSGPSTPPAVTLEDMGTSATPGGVSLKWTTAQEIDLVGFQVYRATNPDALPAERELLTPAPILAQGAGQMEEASYAYMDATAAPKQVYYYWLKAIYTSGADFFGPLLGQWNALYLPLLRR